MICAPRSGALQAVRVTSSLRACRNLASGPAPATVQCAANFGHRMANACWEQPSPTVWPPPHSYREIRVLARQTLPGVRYRRHLLWRFSLVWVKPAS